MQWTTNGNSITLPYVAPEDDLQSTPATIKALAEAIVVELERTGTIVDKIDPYAGTPIGAIMPYMGTRCPNYWLFCDGKSYDARYFKILSEDVNSAIHGDIFRMPDMRGRSPIGQTQLNGGSFGGGWADPHPDFPPNNAGPTTSIYNGERGGDWRMPSHAHRLTSNAIYDPGGTPNWSLSPQNGTSNPNGPLDGGIECWEPISITGQPDASGFGLTPMTPFIGLNFIIYTGLPTYDENGDILPECGQGAEIAPVTTRTMIEERLAQKGIGEEEVKMLKEQLEALKTAEAK